MFGVSVARQRRWTGTARWTPVVMGVYPFVAMFPFVAITGAPSTIAIALWGLPAVLLGLSLLTLAVDIYPSTAATRLQDSSVMGRTS